MSLYEQLLNSWRREREESKLIDMDPEFYGKCREYIQHLENQSQDENDEVIAKLFKKRWSRVNFLINDLLTLRFDKHIHNLMHDVKKPDQLPQEEEELRKSLQTQFSHYRDDVLGIKPNSDKSEELSDEEEYVVVEFIQSDSSESVGADLRTYGPFSEGDLAVIPKPNMRNYLKRSMVEEINISDKALQEE